MITTRAPDGANNQWKKSPIEFYPGTRTFRNISSVAAWLSGRATLIITHRLILSTFFVTNTTPWWSQSKPRWLWDYIKETPTNSGNFSYIGNVGNETIYRPSLTIDLHHLYSGWIPNLKTEASLVVWSWPEVPQVDTAEVVAPYFWSSFSSLATPVIVIIGVLEFNINDGPTLGCDWSTYCSGKNYNSLLFSVMTI